MLTPMDIHDHQFKKSFRGYNENEVDDFLDRVVTDFERLLNENERLRNQLYSNEKELEKYHGLEKTMNDTLMVAQRTADEVISSAKKSAEDLKEQAARECQQIRDQAQFEAKKHIESALAKRNTILEDYAKRVHERNSFMVKMRTILESELAITNHVISTLPNVDEIETRTLPEDKPVEKTAPVEVPKTEQISKIEKPKTEKVPKSKKPAPVLDDTAETNIVNISTKPVTDETKAYKPVPNKEAGK